LKKRSILGIVLALLLFSAVSTAQVSGEDGLPQLVVEPTHVDVTSIGETFTVNITLVIPTGVNITDLWGWQVRVGYNTTVLDCLSASLLPGHPFEGLSVNNPPADIEEEAGYVLYMCSLVGFTENVNVTETSGLCEITFNGTTNGDSPVEFQNINIVGGTYMRRSDASYVTFENVNGSVTVVPEFPLLILMSFFMLTTIAAVFLRKKAWLRKGRNQ